MSQSYQVKLEAFEGPLDLLLHLINKYEIDIYDIPVAQITEQYMEYIHTMQKLELNIASEYLVMAATLISIKSKMLVPTQQVDEENEEYMEDPREELLERLLEYRKYKEAALTLQERERSDNQLFTRDPAVFENIDDRAPSPPVRGDISIYDMLQALGGLFERKKWNEPLDTKIQKAEIPIEQRMNDILTRITKDGDGVPFDHLFDYPSRSHIVITFMALLELMKSNSVYCKQKKQFDAIHIYPMEES
ncbi:segregation/condensation protein A [Virgibacillus oceani]